jgi:hypothetical protein
MEVAVSTEGQTAGVEGSSLEVAVSTAGQTAGMKHRTVAFKKI